MTDYATKTGLSNLEGKLDKRFESIDNRFDELVALMSGFANDVGERFDAVDIRFTRIEARLDVHDEEFRKLNQKYDHLITTIDGFVGRIDRYEVELAARDYKIDRLERWIEQLADKAGVKLT